MKARGFEFSFTWLFAIIVGGTVLFLAVFAATRVANTGSVEKNTVIAAQLDAILSPLETNLETSKTYTINLPEQTRIFNSCNSEGSFGQQQVSTSVDSAGRFSQIGVPVSFFNKYIFSDSNVDGKKLYVLSLPLKMPYKVADLMIVYAKHYCFIDAPSNVKEDLTLMELPLVNFTDDERLCVRDSVKVCFNGENCDVQVDILGNTLRKNGKTIEVYDNLLYSAIFSDSEVYDCQVQRLKKRAAALADLYASKAAIVDSQGCGGNLALDLQTYSDILSAQKSLQEISISAKDLEGKNERILCPLF